MVKGESRVEVFNPDGSFRTVLIGFTPRKVKEFLNDCPEGCTIEVGTCRGRS